MHFRDFDEERAVRGIVVVVVVFSRTHSTDSIPLQNGTSQPDHMNLLELSEALSDVGKACYSFYPGLVNLPMYSSRR